MTPATAFALSELDLSEMSENEISETWLAIYQVRANSKYIHNINVKNAYICHISQNIVIFLPWFEDRTKLLDPNFLSTLRLKITMK